MTQYGASENALIDIWQAHMAAEFVQKDADAAIATMTDHPMLIHVPVNTGATQCDRLLDPKAPVNQLIKRCGNSGK